MPDNAESAVRELLLRSLAAGLFPGAVARWGRGSVTVGRGELAPEPLPVSRDTWFDLASLTKPLVTTTLTLLVFRSGAMQPTTTVGEILPELKGSQVETLEIHELLTHSAGLPAWLPLYCLCEGRPEKLMNSLGRVDLETQPGSRVAYSCIGFVLLGLILETISGVPLHDLFVREITEPLGIGDLLGLSPDRTKYGLAAALFTRISSLPNLSSICLKQFSI